MAIPTPDFSAISNLFTGTITLGTSWLIPLALALVIMALITRDVDKWKILLFPILTMERIIGMPVHFVLLAFAGVMFVIETLSTQVVGNVLGASKKWVKGKTQAEMEKERYEALRMFQNARKREEALMKNNTEITKWNKFAEGIGLPRRK